MFELGADGAGRFRERIKQASMRNWMWVGIRQQHLVSVRSLRATGTRPRSPSKFGAKWIYRVELPERLARDQFIRTMVQVLLLELANRTDRAQRGNSLCG